MRTPSRLETKTLRVLAVADEELEGAYHGTFASLNPDLVVACGDLGFEYLEYLVTTLARPLLYVPGNHDPAAEEAADRPGGCTNIDGRLVEISGLRVGGLGGSMFYNGGPHQYSERQMRQRCKRLVHRATLTGRDSDTLLDVLVTHAPPSGVGDGDDPCHRGFQSFHELIARTSPRVMIHGHIHHYGMPQRDGKVGSTVVMNAVGYRIVEITL